MTLPGHAQLEPVAARGGDHGVGDTRVARGRVEDRSAGPEPSRALGIARRSPSPHGPSPIRRGSGTPPWRRSRRAAKRHPDARLLFPKRSPVPKRSSRSNGVRPIVSSNDTGERVGVGILGCSLLAARYALHSPSITSGLNALTSARSMKSWGSASSGSRRSRSASTALTAPSSTRRKNASGDSWSARWS